MLFILFFALPVVNTSEASNGEVGDLSSEAQSRVKRSVIHYPSRFSRVFGSGSTIFGYGGYYPTYPNGYVYECRGANSTIVRCREVYTTFVSSDLIEAPNGSRTHVSNLVDAMFEQPAGYITGRNTFIYISNLSMPMIWEGRAYFWDRSSYHEDDAENKTMCKANIGNFEEFKYLRTMQTLERPQELVWGCPIMAYCCGIDCCEPTNVDRSWGFIFQIIFLLVACPVMVCACWGCCREEEQETEIQLPLRNRQPTRQIAAAPRRFSNASSGYTSH